MAVNTAPTHIFGDWQSEPSAPLYSYRLDYSLKRLALYSDGSIKLINNTDELIRIRYELQDILSLTQKKIKSEQAYSRKKYLKEYLDAIEKCGLLIKSINKKLASSSGDATSDINEAAHKDHPVAWLVFPLMRWFLDKVKEVRDNLSSDYSEMVHEVRYNQSGLLNSWISEINGERLYWIWGGGLLGSIIGLIPAEMIRAEQASKELGYVSPISGYGSFILYYLRFAIQIWLLCKHTIKNPLMSKEELKACEDSSFLTRLNREWQQRKFLLLNDSVWGSANLVCFFWLCGSGLKGAAGNYLTLGLLFFDLAISIWQAYEAYSKKNKELKAIRAEREAIEQQDTLSDSDAAKLQMLEQQEKRIVQQWTFDKRQALTAIAFSMALIAGFSMLLIPMFPAPAMAVMIISICGAALCFGAILLQNILTNSIEMARTRSEIKENKKQLAELVEAFSKNNLDDVQKRELFSQISQCDYQNKLAKAKLRYQLISMIRSTLIDSMIPVVVFVGTALMSTGVGFGLIGAVIAMAMTSSLISNILFKPRAKEALEYSPEYANALQQELINQDGASTKDKLKIAQRFFKKPKALELEPKDLDHTPSGNLS